jgi:hypothetical protein
MSEPASGLEIVGCEEMSVSTGADGSTDTVSQGSAISMLNSRLRYGPVAQLFHWLTVVLVGTAYMVSPGGSE